MKLQNKKRLGIFAFYDKDGIVDDYIYFLLDDIKKNLSDLIIVSNSNIDDIGMKKLKRYTTEIYIRENKGFDIIAWKKAITEYVFKDRLESYDEVVLFNNSFYGPFYPFKIIFDEMDMKNIDFWGITNHPESLYDNIENACKLDYIPTFIQSYFTVFRSSIIKDKRFIEFWNNLPDDLTYQQAVHLYEVCFAYIFSSWGYKWDTYIDNTKLCRNKEEAICYNTFIPFTMISERKLPILRKKIFCYDSTDYIKRCGYEEPKMCIDYIKNNFNYDVNMIFDNLIRTCNMADLKQSLHLNYVLPTDHSNLKKKPKKKVAAIFHLYYIDLIDDIYKYLSNMPSYVDIYITTTSENNKDKILNKFSNVKNKLQVRVVKNKGREIAALLIDCKDILKKYDYVGFCHDKKSHIGMPITTGKSFEYTLIENIFNNECYVENVIDTFENNPKLGVLGAPSPLHSMYSVSIGYEWTSCYEETEKLSKRLKLKCNLSKDKNPFILGTAFWCRTESLEPLFNYNWKRSDFPKEPLNADGTLNHAIERCFSYVSQSQGFYSGWVMTEDYSSLEIQNLYLLLSTFIRGNMEIYNSRLLGMIINKAKKSRFLRKSYHILLKLRKKFKK